MIKGMKFIDKRQCREALDDYKILRGYDIRITRSTKQIIQAQCMGCSCEWRIWASMCKNEKSFQIKTIPKEHTCIPFSFEKGRRKITSAWLARRYLERIRLLPNIKLRELKMIIDQELNYKASFKLCFHARKKVLAQIVGDYRGQFGLLRDYVHEVLSKNPESTCKITTSTDGEYVFAGVYICLGALKKGMVEGCRRVLSVDGCFIKGPWKG